MKYTNIVTIWHQYLSSVRINNIIFINTSSLKQTVLLYFSNFTMIHVQAELMLHKARTKDQALYLLFFKC